MDHSEPSPAFACQSKSPQFSHLTNPNFFKMGMTTLGE